MYIIIIIMQSNSELRREITQSNSDMRSHKETQRSCNSTQIWDHAKQLWQKSTQSNSDMISCKSTETWDHIKQLRHEITQSNSDTRSQNATQTFPWSHLGHSGWTAVWWMTAPSWSPVGRLALLPTAAQASWPSQHTVSDTWPSQHSQGHMT